MPVFRETQFTKEQVDELNTRRVTMDLSYADCNVLGFGLSNERGEILEYLSQQIPGCECIPCQAARVRLAVVEPQIVAVIENLRATWPELMRVAEEAPADEPRTLSQFSPTVGHG